VKLLLKECKNKIDFSSFWSLDKQKQNFLLKTFDKEKKCNVFL
jgi:hypothetical protein